MLSAGSASFLITCTVLSVLLPPTPEHKTRPSFGFFPGFDSLHLGHPYKMLCLVWVTYEVGWPVQELVDQWSLPTSGLIPEQGQGG